MAPSSSLLTRKRSIHTHTHIQWGKQVFEPLPILQVWPLAKKCVIYNCNRRCILTVRNRISTKKSRKLHFITVKDRSRRPSHHVGCSLVAIFIYSGVFVKPQNIQTQTEHTK